MFVLYFSDGTIFQGKSFPKSDWNNAPDKKITEMHYYIGNVIFVFYGFKQYNHLIENLGYGANGVLKWFLMARTEDETFISVFDNKTKSNYNRVTEIGHEYGRRITTGWKEGVLRKEPTAYIKNKANDRIRLLYPKDSNEE